MSEKLVTAEELRAIFNAHIEPLIIQGVYSLEVMRVGLAHPSSRQPLGTKSVMYRVRNNFGAMIGTAHAYVLPNGSYGGSGRLDPKSLKRKGVLYRLV